MTKVKPKRFDFFFTCEHAGNQIPQRFRKLFGKNKGVLKTHRGWDPVAHEVGAMIAKKLASPYIFTKLSRLVVDMNRSPESPTALSRWTKTLSLDDQAAIFDDYYHPYRHLIQNHVQHRLKNRRVIHFGMHSFSPYLDPARVSCDIGILFDPKSRLETKIAENLRSHLSRLFPDLGIRMNYPYRGDADGLTTDLRKKHGKRIYAGLEIEFNQAFLRKLKKRRSLSPFAFNFSVCLASTLAELNAG